MKTTLLLLIVLLAGCTTAAAERVYAPPIVTGWKDADGKIHLKGEGGGQGYLVIREPYQQWAPLGWGGASR